MKIETTFLRSKVARQILLLFVACALLPILALAFLSYRQVTSQLKQQSFSRLAQATKSVGLSTYDRLNLLETEMKILASSPTSTGAQPAEPQGRLGENSEPRFAGLEKIADDGMVTPITGRIVNPPVLSPAERQHILSGKTAVIISSQRGSNGRVFMGFLQDAQQPKRGIILAEISTSYLWNLDSLPAQTELCVLDGAQQVLFCTAGMPSSFRDEAPRQSKSAKGSFEFDHDGDSLLASYWLLPLRHDFGAPSWMILVTESKADALAALANFKTSFPLVFFMALWVVVLVSTVQIRRSLVPLEKLQEGTRRVAMRDFDSPVLVTSGDEFEELATSFNSMTQRLGRQFSALHTRSEIDRAVLSALDREKIVDTILARLPQVLPCDLAAMTLFSAEEGNQTRTYVAGGELTKGSEALHADRQDTARLRDNPESLLIKVGEPFPAYLAPLAQLGMQSLLLLPIFLESELAGVIDVGYKSSPVYSEDDLAQARQMADQVAVALSSALMIERLDQIKVGTLTALARAIDAKSGWTAGHSERVTDLACDLASHMGYNDKGLERMKRGGLLHDIGKIGTAATILDKPGKLDPEELALMRDHVRMGAHILRPIPGLADVLPIVLEHHEWFNGKGYPAGISGETISIDARIFAVADCFDAMASDRPYRAGMPLPKVMEIIKSGSGTQYDPKVIEAFTSLMEDKKDGPDSTGTLSHTEPRASLHVTAEEKVAAIAGAEVTRHGAA